MMPPNGDPYEEKFVMSGAGENENREFICCFIYFFTRDLTLYKHNFPHQILSHLIVGSPRYMAPEVLVDPPESYNMKADVYTFAIVLWEMFSLEVPYSDIKSRARLVNFVGKHPLFCFFY